VELKYLPASVAAVAMFSFNQTKVELKSSNPCHCIDFAASFNQTKVELKLNNPGGREFEVDSFNQTKVELKFLITFSKIKIVPLLIRPKWN